MKREGHIYEQMAQWENIVEAEKVSTRRKARNIGVRRHVANRWRNLTEIQRLVLDGKMYTAEYQHEKRISGQDKERDIAKLRFHPSHIEHQLLTMAGTPRVDRTLIRHTYASRKGYGQIACARSIRKVVLRYRGQERWYAQGDIRKYYHSIQHTLIRSDMERLFKDKRYVDAFMEPFTRFAPDGVGIPLGIRPSQITGNLILTGFDHYMTEVVHAADYRRYLDDFMFTGATKGEVRRKIRMAEAYLQKRSFSLHEPKVRRLSEGLDMMGYVFYPARDGMWWRRKDKRRWLKRRAHVHNPKRLRELDDAAWGMLKWGNNHGRRMWEKKTGREIKMGVKYKNSGIQRTERVDSNGVPFMDEPRMSMQPLLGKPVEIDRWLKGVCTSQGPGRYALRVLFMGDWYKLIVNAVEIKNFLDDMEKNGVTRLKTVFVDTGSLHYAVDENQTEILEVNGRRVIEHEGKVLFEDNKEEVEFNN